MGIQFIYNVKILLNLNCNDHECSFPPTGKDSYFSDSKTASDYT